MNLKLTAIFLLGFSLFCLIPNIAARETCEIRFFKNGINNKDYIYYDNDNVAPFTGKAWVSPNKEGELEPRTYSSLKAVQANICETCTLTVYPTTTFTGNPEVFSFRDDYQFTFSFCAKSFTLDCEPVHYPEEEEEEEMQEDEEMQIPEEEEEEAGGLQFAPLSPSEANSATVRDLIETGITDAIDLLKQMNDIPAGDYHVVQNNLLEKATNYPNAYQFNVRISDGQGNVFDVIYLIDNNYGAKALMDWNATRVN